MYINDSCNYRNLPLIPASLTYLCENSTMRKTQYQPNARFDFIFLRIYFAAQFAIIEKQVVSLNNNRKHIKRYNHHE